jgi:hypothetical protein
MQTHRTEHKDGLNSKINAGQELIKEVENSMTINGTKTKVMKFRKGGKLTRHRPDDGGSTHL